MTSAALRMCFSDRAALTDELDNNLKLGRTFVRDAHGVDVLADCAVVLVHPDDGAELTVTGQAVLISADGPMRGIGVQLRPFDAQVVSAIEAFVRGERATPVEGEKMQGSAEPMNTESGADSESESESDSESGSDADSESDSGAGSDSDSGSGAGSESGADADAGNSDARASDVQAQPALHERLRKLSVAQQQKIARQGDLQERVMLERLYGKGVWDSLIHNPKLTIPEVASIARKGTIPRPLLEQIVENNTWIQAPVVRRALLGNPRMSGEGIMKLLRITPKHELKIIYKTTTYSSQVREAARKALEL
jgi:hypothetical protein